MSLLSSFRFAFVPRHPGLWGQGLGALLSPPQPRPLEPQNPHPGCQRHSPAPPISYPPPHRPLELHLSRRRELSRRLEPGPLGQQPPELPALAHQPLHQLRPFPHSGLRPLCPQSGPLEQLGRSVPLRPFLGSVPHLALGAVLRQRLPHAALVPHSSHQLSRLAPPRPGLGGLQQAPGCNQREGPPPQDTGAQTLQVPNPTPRWQVLSLTSFLEIRNCRSNHKSIVWDSFYYCFISWQRFRNLKKTSLLREIAPMWPPIITGLIYPPACCFGKQKASDRWYRELWDCCPWTNSWCPFHSCRLPLLPFPFEGGESSSADLSSDSIRPLISPAFISTFEATWQCRGGSGDSRGPVCLHRLKAFRTIETIRVPYFVKCF